MTTLAYGQLPVRAEIMRAIELELGDDPYRIRFGMTDAREADKVGFCEGDFDAEEMWNLLNLLCCEWERGNDWAGDLASRILFTLGIEWSEERRHETDG